MMTNLYVLCGGTAFFTVALFGVKLLLPGDQIVSTFVATMAGGFGGALLRHVNGDGTSAPTGKSNV